MYIYSISDRLMLVMYDAHLDIEQDLNTHRSKYANYKTRYAQKHIIKGNVFHQVLKYNYVGDLYFKNKT